MKKIYSIPYKTFKNFKKYLLLFLFMPLTCVFAQNNSFNFDGNDYIDIPVALNGDYTKELWFKADAISGEVQNLLTGTSTAIYITETGHLGGGNLVELLDPDPIVAGVWYHVAITFNQASGALNLYKNGVLVDSKINPSAFFEPQLQIAAYNSAYFFKGNIDEVRVWDVERTAGEISSSMNCEISHRTSGLIAYYNFNQGIADGNNTSLTFLNDVMDNCPQKNGTFHNVALSGNVSNFSSDIPAPFTGACVAEPIARLTSVNGDCIFNGDSSPSVSDGTDFGITVETPLTHNFNIVNRGTDNLVITSITSSSPDFTVSSPVLAPIPQGGSLTFGVTLANNVVPGVKNATITVVTNDAQNVTYTFDVTGTYAFKGHSLAFDGTFSYVQTPVTISGSYTKEAWINPSQYPATAANIITGTNSALYIDNNGILGGGNLTELTDPSGPLPIGIWTHVAVTYDASTGVLALYKNGIPVATASSNPFSNDDAQQIGAFNAAFLFAGHIDEVRIWSVARSSAEILSSFLCNIPDDATGLVAYYNFEEGTGEEDNTENILTDLTCNHNDGTLIGFALTGAVSNWSSLQSPAVGSCEGLVPNIRVIGNSECISINVSPSTANGTDFGTYSSPGIDHTFTITNTGSANLEISNIVIGGSGAAGFSILSGGGAQTIAPGQSSSFVVRFAHNENEVLNATITILNNDPNEGAYIIQVTGTGVRLVPVTLVNFTGQINKGVVMLKWATSTEINTAGFEVEKSQNSATGWNKIGFIPASNSELGNNYYLSDPTPFSGTNLYRLKIIDNDGSFKYSQIVSLNNLTKATIVKTYPNPFTDKVTISFNDKQLLNSKAVLTTVSGYRLKNIDLNNYNQSIDMSALPAGIYLLKLSNNQVIKLVKQ